MIFVKRAAVACPTILTDVKASGCLETRRAIEFYKLKANHGKPFSYSAYGHESVRRALEQLFNYKCAYCEFELSAGFPVEVEHWRPKGEVEDKGGKKVKPGYYWLAADWSNLLASCVDCNRQRYHEKADGTGTRILLGKKNSFPLANPAKRARKPGSEKLEKPLLINPCVDRPEFALEFGLDHTSLGVVRARIRANGTPDPKALASIETYGLNRSRLVLNRRKFAIEILAQMETVKHAALHVKEAPSAVKRERELDRYHKEFQRLLDYTANSTPYSLMAKLLVAHFSRRTAPRP